MQNAVSTLAKSSLIKVLSFEIGVCWITDKRLKSAIRKDLKHVVLSGVSTKWSLIAFTKEIEYEGEVLRV